MKAFTDRTILQNAVSATGNGNDGGASGFSAYTFLVTGTFTATVTFEAYDGASWNALQVKNYATGAITTTATAAGAYVAAVAGLHLVRARVTWTSGTSVTVVGVGSTAAISLGTTTATGTSSTQVQGTAASGATPVGNPVYVAGSDSTPTIRPLRTTPTGVIRISPLGTNAVVDGQAAYVQPRGDDSEGLAGVSVSLSNNSTFDPMRANYEATVLSSAARTSSTDSSDQTNYNARGVVVVIDVTSITDTPSITVTIQGKSSLGTDYYTILASAAITATGQTVLRVCPGLTAVANSKADDLLPRVWRVSVVHGDADSITYSISANHVL